jgi:hypothetical protein
MEVQDATETEAPTGVEIKSRVKDPVGVVIRIKTRGVVGSMVWGGGAELSVDPDVTPDTISDIPN